MNNVAAIESLVLGSTVRVNGKKFTVATVGAGIATLTGSRGGWAGLVENVNGLGTFLTSERGSKKVTSLLVAL